jgi:hypothetical protein
MDDADPFVPSFAIQIVEPIAAQDEHKSRADQAAAGPGAPAQLPAVHHVGRPKQRAFEYSLWYFVSD